MKETQIFTTIHKTQSHFRLISSMIPGVKGADFSDGNADLYGPSMVVFTLISILVFTLKNSPAHIVSCFEFLFFLFCISLI
jgi:hypothetical protein